METETKAPLSLSNRLEKFVNDLPACSFSLIRKRFSTETENDLEETLEALVKSKLVKDIPQRRGMKDNRFWGCGAGNVDIE